MIAHSRRRSSHGSHGLGCAGVLVATAVASLCATETRAFADDDHDSAAWQANSGLRIELGPVLIAPSNGGPLGGGADLDVRYGIGAGPVIIAPGGRLAGYYVSHRFIGTAMPEVRFTFPLGPLAPYLLGGVGGGWISNPSEGGVALLGGGGLMIHFGRVFAIGAEVSYQTITSTGFGVLAFGPRIAIGF